MGERQDVRVMRGEKSRAFSGDKAIGGDAESCVVMEPAPTSTLEMIDADFVLELLVVAFDAPPHVDGLDQVFERGGGRKIAQVVFGWC